MATKSERRQQLRSKPGAVVALKGSLEDAPAGQDGNLFSRLIDISTKGACVATTSVLPQGSRVQVEILLPGARGRFTTHAVVRWGHEIRHEGKVTCLAGLEFEKLFDVATAKSGEISLMQILLNLRVAVAQLRLYPKDSPQVLKVAADTFHSVHSHLEDVGTLTLSRTPRGLLVNGIPLPDTGPGVDAVESAMLTLLAESQIKSATFKKGLTLDELITFLHALTKKFWDIKDGKEINKRLREERVFRMSVDEVQYVAVGEGDIVIEDAARKLEGGDTELARILAALDNVIDSSVPEGIASEGRLHIMKRLLDKDPTLLRRVGDQAPAAKQEPGQAAAPGPDDERGRLTFDEARESLGDLARVLWMVPQEIRDPLRRMGRILVAAFRHNPKLSAILGAFLSENVNEAVSDAKQEAARKSDTEPAAIGRALQLMALPEDEKMQTLTQEGGALLDELSALNRPEMVRGLLESLAGSVGDRSAKRRLAACRALNTLRRAHERNATDEMLEALEVNVRSGLEQEREPSVYPALAELASSLADVRIRKGKLDPAGAILDVLRRHYQIKDPSFVQRGEMAYVALERIAAGAGFTSLGERIRSADPDAVRVLETLDVAATRFLIREIKKADDLSKRLSFAQFISRAGPSAATILLDELQKTSVPSDVLHLMEILPHAMPSDMAEMALGPLLRHATVTVRRRTAVMIAEQAYLRGGRLLLDALKEEKDEGTRTVLVEAIGRLRPREAFDPLSSLSESRNETDEVRAAACMALGRLGDVRAVALLSRLCLKGEKGITQLLRQTSPAVRASAARALSAFPGSKDAREALRKALEDKDSTIRSAASQGRYLPIFEAFGDLAKGSERISSAEETSKQRLNVSGALVEVPLDEIGRRLGLLEATGLLRLHYAGSSARMYLDAGLVISVDFEGQRDQDAVNAIVRRRGGYFLFLPDERTQERRILTPPEALLDEALRLRADLSQLNPED